MKGFNWLAAVCLVASVADEARAETKTTRLTVELTWENMPRTDPDIAVLRKATVPKALIFYGKAKDGGQKLIVSFNDGITCGTFSPPGQGMSLMCGRDDGNYSLTKDPGEPINAEWVITTFD